MNDIYIANGARTPMGGFQGSLQDLTGVELGAIAIREAIHRSDVSPDKIDEVIMGCVLPAGLRQGPARQAAINAEIPVEVGATTINKLCGSGMKATMLAHDLIKAGTTLRLLGKKKGLAALCIGGGEATAIAIELV